MVELRSLLREHIKDAIFPAVAPLCEYDREKGHEVMTLLLDPRYCKGEIFMRLAIDSAAGKALFKQYTDQILIPVAASLKNHLLATPTGGTRDARDGAPIAPPRETALTDSDDEQADPITLHDEGIRAQVEKELKKFRRHEDLPVSPEDTSPLEWWKEHADDFPILSQLARIVLAVPGSQIECERVFSLAGLLTKNLRNKMCAERLDHMVFLGKNLDLDVELHQCLASHYGEQIYEKAAPDFKPLSETQLAEDFIAPDDDGAFDFYNVNTLLDGSEPLVDSAYDE